MQAFVSHNSALGFWQEERCRTDQISQSPLKKRRTVADRVLSREEFSALDGERAFPQTPEHPLHLMVSDKGTRSWRQDCVAHVATNPFPAGAFATLAPGLFISTPEECFMEMAQTLNLYDLLLLGYEMCGTYAEKPRRQIDSPQISASVEAEPSDQANPAEAVDEGSVQYEIKPLTTPEHLAEYLMRCTRRPGLPLARKAASFVLAKSASPMETRLAMLLTLPMKHGGYGLPHPALNARIDLEQRARRIGKRQWCSGDLVWEPQKVIVEYDSNAFHTGSNRIAADSERRDALLLEGYQVVTVTWAQLADAERFDALAKMLAKTLGWRLRERSESLASARDDLRRHLFPYLH